LSIIEEGTAKTTPAESIYSAINLEGNQLDPLKIRQRLIRLNEETGFGSGYDNVDNDIGDLDNGRIEEEACCYV
jgi:hypothetical protein